jgi:hypothetical protein
MPYTFGGATTDRYVLGTIIQSLYNASRVTLITQWVYPTTLTATRLLHGTDVTSGLAIDTTTTSLRLTLDFVTTDGVWTAPASLVINKWQFVALLVNIGSATTVAVKCFVGDEDNPPAEKTVTQATGPAGAITASSTAVTIGNSAAGSLAFQGDIGVCSFFSDSSTGVTNTLGIAADGTISAAQIASVLNQFINPLWRGEYNRLISHTLAPQTGSRAGFVAIADMNDIYYAKSSTTSGDRGSATVTGATVSTVRQSPRSLLRQHRSPVQVHPGLMRRGYAA